MRRLTFADDRCLACRSCEIACVVAHSTSGTLTLALDETPVPRRRVTVTAGGDGIDALRCQQCDEPLCVFACKSGALSRDPVTGTTRLDEGRCLGCAMCLMVCPFGLRADPGREVVVRCDVCAGRDVPACVAACPTHALGVGDEPSPRPSSPFSGHLVVVGSSAAGIAACEAAREAAPACSITLVTMDDERQVSRPLLTYALAGRVEREALGWRPAEYLEGVLRVEVRRGVRATTLRSEARRVDLVDGTTIAYDALVIATGARAQMLRVPGSELPGVLTLRNVEDLEALETLIRPGGRAVVVGGGNVGLQTCEALLARGLDVTVVYRSSHLLSQMVDAEAGRRTAELFALHKIGLRPGRDVAEILGPESVTTVRLDDGELLPAELVVVGKGIVPNVEWLADSGLEVKRGIVVDRHGRTNVPDVFAAGDCAEGTDPVTGQSAVSGVWPVAYEMGRAAGAAAVGLERPSAGALRLNASRFFGLPLVSIGEVREERLSNTRAEVQAADANVYRKLVFRGDRLVGALLYGDISEAGRLYRRYREAPSTPPASE